MLCQLENSVKYLTCVQYWNLFIVNYFLSNVLLQHNEFVQVCCIKLSDDNPSLVHSWP